MSSPDLDKELSTHDWLLNLPPGRAVTGDIDPNVPWKPIVPDFIPDNTPREYKGPKDDEGQAILSRDH